MPFDYYTMPRSLVDAVLLILLLLVLRLATLSLVLVLVLVFTTRTHDTLYSAILRLRLPRRASSRHLMGHHASGRRGHVRAAEEFLRSAEESSAVASPSGGAAPAGNALAGTNEDADEDEDEDEERTESTQQ